jgi:uncharacterized protein
MSFRPPPLQSLRLAGKAGQLEALLEEPADGTPRRFGVVCHPHPLHGGTMHNKVVHTVARALQELGTPTLRFNYRGVGTSEGSYDEGRGETADALSVIEWGRTHYPHATLVLAGFSFGAMVALRAAAVAAPAQLITVAPAVTRADYAQIARPDCPWLLIQGDADDVVDPAAVSAWAQRLNPPPVLKVLAGAGHFFHGRLHELRDAVLSGLDWR